MSMHEGVVRLGIVVCISGIARRGEIFRGTRREYRFRIGSQRRESPDAAAAVYRIIPQHPIAKIQRAVGREGQTRGTEVFVSLDNYVASRTIRCATRH